MENDNNQKRVGSIVSVTLAMLVFGTVGLVRKMIPFGSGLVAASRGIVGAAVIALFSLLIRKPVSVRKYKKSLPWLLVSGVALGVNWILLFEAFSYTTVAIATLCNYMAPVIVILLSPILLRERPTAGKIVCAAVSMVGMVLVSGVFSSGLSGMRGILIALASAFFYAAVVLINQKIGHIPPIDRTFMQLVCSGAVLIPYVLLAEGLPTVVPSASGWIALAVICVVHTGIAYLLYFGGMIGAGAIASALLSYIDPLTAVLISAAVLREPMSVLGWIGAVLILGSTAAVEIAEARRK